VNIHRLTLDEWNKMSENAHFICFREKRDPSMNTFDFALFVEDNDKPMSYATCIEMDKESVYMQHGGAFPSIAGTALSYRSYHVILKRLAETYKRASTRIQNTNTPMLKMAIRAGFLINGVDVLENEIFVHLKNDFSNSVYADA